MSSKTITFPRGSISGFKRHGDCYVFLKDLLEAFDVWTAILEAGEAPEAALETARSFRAMLAGVEWA